jgi:hypothetical protein
MESSVPSQKKKLLLGTTEIQEEGEGESSQVTPGAALSIRRLPPYSCII